MWYKNSTTRFVFRGLLVILPLVFLSLQTTLAQEVLVFGDNRFHQADVPSPLSGVMAVSGGHGHGAALKTNGTVDVWGILVADNAVTDVIAIASGTLHIAALRADGTVVAWGSNTSNQLNVPGGLTNVKAIAAGGNHTLALKDDGTVVGWGDNSFGQSTSPLLADIIAISAGAVSSHALKADGTVVSWGATGAPPNGLNNVIAIDAGGNHNLALKADGTVVAWGDNTYGQCTIPVGLANVIAVSAGTDHSVALKADGTIAVWGRNHFNQLSVPGGLVNVIEISAGEDFTLVRKSDNARVRVWGSSAMGEPNFDLTGIKQASGGNNFGMALKLNGTITVWGAGLGAPGTTNVKAIASGLQHGVALLANGVVTAWGDNARGQLDIPPGLANVKEIVAGRYHTLALKADGTVVAWGANGSGESTVPNTVTPAFAIGAGQFHSLAIKADGTAFSWGQGNNSQAPTPAWVPKVKTVSGGNNHSIALKSDGTIAYWGGNTHGQGTIPTTLAPVRALVGGQFHNLAVKADGTLFDWGAHNNTIRPEGIDDVQFISTAAAASIVIITDHAPVIGNVTSTVQYKEDASAQSMQNTITITDNGHAALAGATISISGGFVAGDKLSVTAPSGLVQSYDDATGILSITGTQTVAEFQTMLRSLSYHSTSATPGTNATRTVTITVTDGVSAGSPANFTIDILPVNDAPSFTKGADITVNEDATAQTRNGWATGISKGPSDESGQRLTFNVGNDNTTLFSVQPSIDASGKLTFTPAANKSGTANITVSLSDDGGIANGGVDRSADQTFVITINPVNDAPSFSMIGSLITDEDHEPINVNWASSISAGAADEASQTLTFEIENDNNGLFSVQPVINPSGRLSFTLAPNVSGNALVTVRLVDNGGTANGGSDRAVRTFQISVRSVNDAPSFTKGSDVVIDEDAGTQTITGWAANMSPGPANEAVQTLTFSVSNNNTGLFSAQPSLNAAGDLTFTPAPDAFGVASVTVTLTDNGGTISGGVNSVSQPFTITINGVNDAPAFTTGTRVIVWEDMVLTNPSGGWLNNPSPGANEVGQTLTVQTENDNNDLFSVQPTVDLAGELRFTLAPDANGSAIVTVRLVDDGGTAYGGIDRSQRTFAFTVQNVNDAPSFTKGPDITINEDAGLQSINAWATNISAGPADEAAQALTFSVSNNDNAGLFDVQPALSAAGNLIFAPAANVSGVAHITLVLADDGGTLRGGVNNVSQTFTITVNDVNDAPSFTKGADVVINEDAAAQTVAGWAANISAGPVNESSQSTSFNVSNDNNGLFSVQPSVSASGDLTFTPAANKFGEANVRVSIIDDGGTLNGGINESAEQTFRIEINAINDAPSFTAGPDIDVDEDAGAQAFNGWATNLLSGPEEPAQHLTVTVINDNNALFRVQPSMDMAGNLTFTPQTDASGTARVSVQLSDNGGTTNGGIDEVTKTFDITIHSVNDAPSFTNGVDIVISEDAGAQTYTGWATDISAGPSDELSQVLMFVVTNDNNGLFSSQPSIDAQGTLTFTPAANAHGSVLVTAIIKDNGGTANGGSDNHTQVFTITIESVNEPPAFTPGPDVTVLEDDAPYAATWAKNVTAGPGENSQVLTFEVIASNMELFERQPAIDRSGVLSFTLAPNRSGTSTVSVLLRDNGGITNGGNDQSSGTSFTITVLPVNDAPGIDRVEDMDLDTNTDPITLMLTGIDAGGDHQVVSVAAISDDPSLVVISAIEYTPGSNTAAMVLTPSRDKGGVATVTVKVKDNGGVVNGGVDETIMTFKVNIEEVISTVFIPNLFTPDGNGTNDVFRVRASGVSEVKFSVYDALGREVFSTSDVDVALEGGWDGRYRGKDQPSGMYTWVLTGKYTDGRSLTSGDSRYGQVLLMR